MQSVRGARGMLVALALALPAIVAATAAAQPGSGPRETVDQGFTTTRPGAPTGTTFSGVYHAAGDPKGNPPYMRRMVFYPPPGMRYDTSVPEQCTASDLELSVRGPDACPAGSRLGTGTTEGIFYEPVRHDFVFDNYQHTLDVMNNAGEQILLVKAEGYSVVRGKVNPDGSMDFRPPTCFPTPPTGQCTDDYVLQLKSSSVLAPITKGDRSYATTPPTCPAARHWSTTIRFWWADGSEDTVVTTQPCAHASAARISRKRRSHGRRARTCCPRRAAARRPSSSTR